MIIRNGISFGVISYSFSFFIYLGELLNTSQSLCSFYPDISSQKISEDQNDLVARVNFSQIPFKDSFDGSKSPIVPLQTDEQWIDMANSSEMRIFTS